MPSIIVRRAIVMLALCAFGACHTDHVNAQQAVAQPAALRHAEELPQSSAVNSDSPTSAYHLSLEEAKFRALENSVVMDLASQQIAVKCFALDAARKDFLPKLLNSFTYFHFDRDLGTVLTTPGILNPATTIAVPVVEQDATTYTAAAIQPITPLLKVQQAVNISQIDVATAQAQKQFARREITKGVEQLYLGLLAVQRMRSGLEQAAAGAEQVVNATNSPDAKISLLQIRQNLVEVNSQASNVNTQLAQLVNLSPCAEFTLDQPPLPPLPFGCRDEVVNSAIAASPQIREAKLQVEKAEAAVKLAQSDYVPTVNAFGFYVNQDATPVIQNDFTGVGLSANYMLEWGKKNDKLREMHATEALARKALQKQFQDMELSAAKTFQEAIRAQQALDYAEQLAQLQRDAKLPSDPFQLKFALKDRLEAEIAAIKAELDYRNAVVELRSIAGLAE